MTISPPPAFKRPLLIAGAVLAACVFILLLFSAGGGLLWYRLNDVAALPPLLALGVFAGGMAALRAPEHYRGLFRFLHGAVLGLAVFLLAVSVVAILLMLDSASDGSWGLFGVILSFIIILGHVFPLVATAAALLFLALKEPKQ
jgi:hypothetical protein